MAYTICELAKLALASYETIQKPVDDWLPVAPYGRPGHQGFYAVLYGYKDQRFVFAIRGTDNLATGGREESDIGDDAAVFMGLVSKQMLQARAALSEARSVVPKSAKLALTGHSLGGGLAALLAIDTNLRCVTFNAPGTSRSYGTQYAMRYAAFPQVALMLKFTAPYAAYTDRILNLRASGDVISVGTGPHLGRVTSINVRGCEVAEPTFIAPAPLAPRANAGARAFLQVASAMAPATDPIGSAQKTTSEWARYTYCQHGMQLMLSELRLRSDYNRDLGW